jgi:low temperature requirement protein LtrA
MTTLLRSRDEHARVTYVELFFDLVFVFAVTQLSHGLLANLTPLGFVQIAVLMLAMWWQWIDTSWVTNWLDPGRMPVRVALFALMLVGLLISAAAPRAFEDAGLIVGCAYAAMQLGRDAFVLWAVWSDDAKRRNFLRITSWHVVCSSLWIAGGFVDPSVRLALWAFAMFLETIAPSFYFWTPWLGRSPVEHWDIEGAHMAERCALFIIIALGESILVTGATFAGLDWTGETIAAFIIAFIGSVALWWIYFNASAERASAVIGAAREPGRLARLAYTYIHILIVGGIIVSAVGDELVLAHPSGHTDLSAAAVIVGGPALYLAGVAAFKLAVFGAWSWTKLAGIAALAGAGLAYQALSPLALAGVVAAILVVLAAWETFSLRESPALEAGTEPG